MAADQQVFETRLSVIHEERAIAKSNGLVRIYRAVKHPILHRVTGEVIGLIGVSTDITDIVELREQLYQLANTDSLTQLCNRRKLWADFRAAFARAKRLRQPLSCISIDIDNFKLINDQLVTIKVMKSCVFSPNYFRASSLTIILWSCGR